MGRFLKIVAFVVGLSVLGFGAWLLALLLLLYSFSGFIFRGRKRAERVESRSVRGPNPIGKRQILGLLLLLMAAVGAAMGGRFSVVFFGGLGIAVLFWGKLPVGLPLHGLKPAKESVLLRSSTFPLTWVSVSEVKTLTRNVGGILSSITDPLIIVVSPKPSIYVVTKTLALTRSQAMERMTERISGLAIVLLQVGGYLLPLDSGAAEATLQVPLERIGLGKVDWKFALSTAPYDVVVFGAKAGLVESLGLYRRNENKPSGARIPGRFIHVPVSPMLWEAIKLLEPRVVWPKPDDMVSYLVSLGATRGEPLANRLSGGTVGPDTVVAESFGGRKVELKASQLRALVKVYG